LDMRRKHQWWVQGTQSIQLQKNRLRRCKKLSLASTNLKDVRIDDGLQWGRDYKERN